MALKEICDAVIFAYSKHAFKISKAELASISYNNKIV